jgi:hypothetical protein
VADEGTEHLADLGEVFFSWASPMLDHFEDAPIPAFKVALEMVAFTWTLGAISDEPAATVVDEVIEEFSTPGLAVPPELRTTLAELVDRRRTEYAFDPRLVGAVEVVGEGEDIQVSFTCGLAVRQRTTTV